VDYKTVMLMAVCVVVFAVVFWVASFVFKRHSPPNTFPQKKKLMDQSGMGLTQALGIKAACFVRVCASNQLPINCKETSTPGDYALGLSSDGRAMILYLRNLSHYDMVYLSGEGIAEKAYRTLHVIVHQFVMNGATAIGFIGFLVCIEKNRALLEREGLVPRRSHTAKSID
jgi:hypothetical protein